MAAEGGLGAWIDRAIAELARRQRGFVTRCQLLDLGLSSGAIRNRVRAGRLIQVYVGVYAVGHVPATPIDFAFAALLACGRGAALCHHSALSVWGWGRLLSPPFHVAAKSKHKRPGIVAHRIALTRRDVRTHLGIRVTSPARTLLDVSPELPDLAIRRAMREARSSPFLRIEELEELLARFPRHPGTSVLTPFVAREAGPTRSEFEDAFVAFCERFGLPRPRMNARVGGYEVDALFEAERLIVELDGYQYHHGRDSFEGDRERDAVNLVAGFGTVRITWRRMTGTPAREAERLETILRARRGPEAGDGQAASG